jgi:hypothetical protein
MVELSGHRVTCSASDPSSILYVHACHPCGALPAHWACRMFSGPWGIVVVRASWSGHPTLIRKKMHLKTSSSWVKATYLDSFFIFNGPRYLTRTRYSIKKKLQDPTRASRYFILIQYVLF